MDMPYWSVVCDNITHTERGNMVYIHVGVGFEVAYLYEEASSKARRVR